MGEPRRHRRLFSPITRGAAHAVVFLFVLSVLLSAASGVIAVRAVQGEIRSRASTTALCEAGNDARAQQVTLWTHLIAISVPPPHQTPAQKAQRAKLTRSFLAYVRHVFMPRNCGRLTGG